MDKDTEEGRLVHVFTQLNYTSVSSKTPPMPKPNVIIDGMSTSTIFPFIDLMDGFYSIILRERNILRRALITNIVIIYERLMIGLRLCCAASTFKGLIPNRLISMRDFAPSYLNDRFARSLSKDGNSDLEVHRLHFRKTLTLTRDYKLYANHETCLSVISEVPLLGCILDTNSVRLDLENINPITDCLV